MIMACRREGPNVFVHLRHVARMLASKGDRWCSTDDRLFASFDGAMTTQCGESLSFAGFPVDGKVVLGKVAILSSDVSSFCFRFSAVAAVHSSTSSSTCVASVMRMFAVLGQWSAFATAALWAFTTSVIGPFSGRARRAKAWPQARWQISAPILHPWRAPRAGSITLDEP